MTRTAAGLGSNTRWALEGAWVVLAVLVHAALIGGMPKPPRQSGAIVLGDSVDMSFIEDEREPEVMDQPLPVKPPAKRRRFRRPPRPTERSPVAQETPAAFDNVVLTDESNAGSTWSAEQASGKSVEGPVGSPNAAVTGESKMGVGGGAGVGVVVEIGDLSRELFAPSSNRMLKRFPDEARAEYVDAEAFVRLQIGSDGVQSDWQVIAEGPPGYGLGKACVARLKKEAWPPEVDAHGTPVTARVIYRCGFEIR